MARSVTIYRERDGNIVKLPGSAKARESYDGIVGKPFHQRVIESFYKLECNQTLRDSDCKEFGGKGAVRDIHMRALEQGF